MSRITEILLFGFVIATGFVVGFSAVSFMTSETINPAGIVSPSTNSDTVQENSQSPARESIAEATSKKPDKPPQPTPTTTAAQRTLDRAWELAKTDCNAALSEATRVANNKDVSPALLLDASKLSYKCEAWAATLRFSNRVLQISGSDEEKARAYDWLAYANFRQNNLGKAIEQKKKQIALERETATPRNLSRAFGWLGRYYRENSDLDNAKKSVLLALDYAKKAKSRKLVDNHMVSLASLLLASGDSVGACAQWKKLSQQTDRVKVLIAENCS